MIIIFVLSSLNNFIHIELYDNILRVFSINVSLTPVANLSPVSTTQGELVAKFAAGVVDTSGKFAAGVVETGGKFATGVVDSAMH
jgi:hypothetical protein